MTCNPPADPTAESILLAARRDALRLAADAAIARTMLADLEDRARGQADKLARQAAALRVTDEAPETS